MLFSLVTSLFSVSVLATGSKSSGYSLNQQPRRPKQFRRNDCLFAFSSQVTCEHYLEIYAEQDEEFCNQPLSSNTLKQAVESYNVKRWWEHNRTWGALVQCRVLTDFGRCTKDFLQQGMNGWHTMRCYDEAEPLFIGEGTPEAVAQCPALHTWPKMIYSVPAVTASIGTREVLCMDVVQNSFPHLWRTGGSS